MILKLVLNKIIKWKFKSALIIFSILISIFFTVFSVLLYKNIENFFINQNIWKDSERMFEIIVKDSAAWLFFKDKSKNLNNINELYELEKDENIERIHFFYNIDIPVSSKINFLWQEIDTDIFIFLASDNYFNEKELKKDYIPISISNSLINLYNTQLANDSLFPKIPEKLVYTVWIDLFFWRSTFFNYWSQAITKKWKIVKMSTESPLVWMTIPYSQWEKILNKIGKWKITLYKAVWYAYDTKYINNIKKEYNNFTVRTNEDRILKIKNKLSILEDVLKLLNIIITLILICFLVYVIFSIINENKKIFETFRLHWAWKIKILKLILTEILFYVFIAIIIMMMFWMLFKYWMIDKINIIISEQYYLEYQIELINKLDMVKIIWGYISIISLLTIIFSWREWNKKFENK
jgi:hypothetical protein